MSEFDQAGDEQRPDEGDREAAVDGALQQAAAVESATSEAPQRRSKGQILALLMIPLVIVGSWSVWTLTRPVPPLKPQAQEALSRRRPIHPLAAA